MEIKETMEMLQGLEAVAVAGVKIAKNGLDLSDLTHVKDLVGKADELKLAVEGASEIPKEFKDLSAEEIATIVAKVFAIAAALKAANA